MRAVPAKWVLIVAGVMILAVSDLRLPDIVLRD